MDQGYYFIGFIVLLGVFILWYYIDILIKDKDREISFGKRRQKISINLDDHFDRPWSTIIMLGFATVIIVILGVMIRLVYSTI